MSVVRGAGFLFVAASLLMGCKADPAVSKGEPIGVGTKAPVPPPNVAGTDSSPAAPLGKGGIAGTILFSGKPPAMATIDTSMDPACSMGGNSGPVKAEQIAVSNGKLANVFLYVKTGPAAVMQAPAPAQPVVMDQKGCRYIPHVIGVAAGGYVEFHNSDVTMHNVHTMPADVGNQTIDVSQGPKGAPQSKQMLKPELMIPVRCNNHPWMNAFINVAPTPYFAVSDAAGHFEIHGLPAGDYVIGAVQEKLGEKTMNVHVDGNGMAKAEFSFGAQ